MYPEEKEAMQPRREKAFPKRGTFGCIVGVAQASYSRLAATLSLSFPPTVVVVCSERGPFSETAGVAQDASPPTPPSSFFSCGAPSPLRDGGGRCRRKPGHSGLHRRRVWFLRSSRLRSKSRHLLQPLRVHPPRADHRFRASCHWWERRQRRKQ